MSIKSTALFFLALTSCSSLRLTSAADSVQAEEGATKKCFADRGLGEEVISSEDNNDEMMCSLYLAPSSIPGAGLGIYTTVDLPAGSRVGEADAFIPIIDQFKTLPYRGQQRFLSWLGYVWPEEPHAFYHSWDENIHPPVPDWMFEVNEGLNAARGVTFWDGEQRVSAFAPGVASLVNSHAQYANVGKDSSSEHKDWAGLELGKDYGVGAFTPHHGVSFTATRDIPAGTELLIDYGEDWQYRFDQKNGEKEDFPPLEYYKEQSVNDRELPSEQDARRDREKQRVRQEQLRKKFEHVMKKEEIVESDEPEEDAGESDGEEDAKVAKQRVRVVVKQPDGMLDISKMAWVDVPASSSVETVIATLYRLEIPRTFWNIARIELHGFFARGDLSSQNPSNPLRFYPFEEDDAVEDVLSENDYLVVDPVEVDANQDDELEGESDKQANTQDLCPAKQIDWLKENGVCIDNIRVGKSTVDQAGRGAFAKRLISKGSLIAPAPLVALKREDLAIYEANSEEENFRDVLNLEEEVGKELVLNYCYGHKDSELLLLPYSPVVNFINHGGQAANAEIRWSENSPLGDPKEWQDMHPLDVLDLSGKLMMEIVALRDIRPGEEIFIDYGREWEDAWKKYESDRKLEAESNDFVYGSFRHEIGAPDGFFPDRWKHKSFVYEPAPFTSPLKAGEVVPLRWAHNGKVISKTAWAVGLPQGFSDHMLKYSNDMGITKAYEKLLQYDVLASNEWFVFDSTDGNQWFAQRFESDAWNFNMHYVAAWDKAAHVSLLRALGSGGYDIVLKSLTDHFGYKNITCFHISYMGVSECDKSKTHADVYGTGEKGLNIVFPIITVNGSKPELDIQSDNANILLSVKYLNDIAYVLSDYGYHKTSPIQYDDVGQMRVVIGMYCAQIDESNAKMLKWIYEGEAPAPFYDQFDLPLKEAHWGDGFSLPK